MRGSLLIEEQAKILKFMNEMTGRVDINEFAKKSGLTSKQLGENMLALAKVGLLKKVGDGFSITEKGKTALKAIAPMSQDLRFHFYFAVGHPMGVSAGSIKDFHDLVSKLSVVSVEFHLVRGDFETWFRTSVCDAAFADELAKIKKSELKGEDLRKAIVKALEAKYAL
jgi:predicted transcriptional regulator